MALDDYLESLRCRATPEIALRTRDSGRAQFSVPEILRGRENEVRDSEQRSDAQQGRYGASDHLSWAS